MQHLSLPYQCLRTSLLVLLLVLLHSCTSSQRLAADPSAVRPDATLRAAQDQHFQSLYLEALRQKHAKHYDAALDLLNEALRLQPQAVEVLHELSNIWLNHMPYTNSMTDSIGERYLDTALQLQPHNLSLLKSNLERLEKHLNYEELVHTLQEIISISHEKQYYTKLLNFYVIFGDLDKALQTIEEIEKREGESTDTSLEAFRIFLYQKKYTKALHIASRLENMDPNNLMFAVLPLQIYTVQYDMPKAYAQCDTLRQRFPNKIEIQHVLYRVYQTFKDSAKTDEMLHKLLLNDDIHPEEYRELLMKEKVPQDLAKGDTFGITPYIKDLVHHKMVDYDVVELAYSYLEYLKEPTDSLTHFLDIFLERLPKDKQLRYLALYKAGRNKDYARMRKLSKEGLKFFPHDINLYDTYYRLLLQDDQKQKALDCIQTAAKMCDSASDSTHILCQMYSMAAYLYSEEGDTLQALDYYERAVNSSGCEGIVFNNYAYLLAQQGIQLDKAEQMVKMSLDLNPSSPHSLDTYAYILLLKGEDEKALEQANLALHYAEKDQIPLTNYYQRLGQIYESLGQTSAALTAYQSALKSTQDTTEQKTLQERIKACSTH